MTTTAQAHSYDGTLVTIYYMDNGDKIPRHQHPYQHTVCVIVGAAVVEVFTTPPQITPMDYTTTDLTLAANTDHEITAETDGTVVMNVVTASELAASVPAPSPPPQAGVMLVCGCTITPVTIQAAPCPIVAPCP
jgi:quercetin dioxygenase-like cupin family protein